MRGATKAAMGRALVVLAAALLFCARPGSAEDDVTGRISALIRGLGSATWAERESAQKDLGQLGEGHAELVIERLLDAYITEDDPEIRERACGVLRSLALANDYRKKAFLGVRLRPGQAALEIGGKVVRPIDIESVLPDTAAVSNGVLTGDMIMQVDEHVCNELFGVEEFVRYVSGKTPGDKVRLDLRRGGKIERLEIALGERPPLPGEPSQQQQEAQFFRQWLEQRAEERIQSRPAR